MKMLHFVEILVSDPCSSLQNVKTFKIWIFLIASTLPTSIHYQESSIHFPWIFRRFPFKSVAPADNEMTKLLREAREFWPSCKRNLAPLRKPEKTPRALSGIFLIPFWGPLGHLQWKLTGSQCAIQKRLINFLRLILFIWKTEWDWERERERTFSVY